MWRIKDKDFDDVLDGLFGLGFFGDKQVEAQEDKSETTERAEIRVHDKERGWSSGRWIPMEEVRSEGR